MSDSNNQKFNHLKIHTQYSICEGAIKIDKLKDFCKENKIQCLGLSDTSNLCGALEFAENISKVGTQPIIGTQINFKYEDTTGLLPLIALNEKGYKRIINLSSKSYLENDNLSDPHLDIKELLIETEGVIILSGTIHGLFGKLFEKGRLEEISKLYQAISKKFNDRFYLEIQRHGDQNEIAFEKFNLQQSSKLNIPIIATNEVYYLTNDMHEAHDALTCIGSKTYVNEKNRVKYSNQHYFKSDEEMSSLFSDLPEALKNNFNLPFRCNFRPQFSKPILPNISSEKDGSADLILKKDSFDGLKQKFLKIFKIEENDLETNENFLKYKDRLDHELKIIIEMKYPSYFLIVSDYIKWAKSNDIPVGPGRGSGAGSLVAWCLSITDVDPIKFNLIFERFLNPDRISMPDFDIDFCEEKRDLVFEYLTTKYKESVAHIITFGKLKARMVIRDVGRVLGLPYGFVDSISKMIPFDPSRPLTLTECINNEPRLQKLVKEDPRVKKLTDLSLKLEGLNRNVATHAAGVVIADKKLTETVPLYKDASANLLLPSTQFDMYSAENAGLIKFDFLGLKTLTVINRTQKLINKKIKDFKVEEIDYEDQKVFDLLSSGNTVGLFQVESAGMREALMKMKPNHLEDIIALVALYRPGPMSNIPIYNDCKHGRQQPDYLHPLLEEILKPTYGVIIYQEQVMQIAQKLSGFTAGEADILRRAMGKKKRAELEKQKQGFINGAVKNGIAKDVAASIFLKIEPFAEYGFNKSHAAAYAIISYQTAFLKTYYPKEFFAASMTMDLSNQNKLSEFYEELKRMNIKIIRPDINKCFADFKFDDDNFYYALGGIKSVGFDAISNVVKERIDNGEFKSINDFLNRVNPKDINKLQLEGLVKAGAFDGLENNRNSLFSSIPNFILKTKNIHENKIANQIDLFSSDDEQDNEIILNVEDWKFEERLSREFEAIGFFISDHPLNQFKEIFDDYKIVDYSGFNSDDNIKEANIAATLLKLTERKTAKGNSYAVIKFTDLSSVFELFIFSDILELNREALVEGSSLIITLSKSISNDENRFKRINVLKIASLKNLFNKPVSSITFNLKSTKDIDQISNFLQKEGSTEVKINIINKENKINFKLKNKRQIDRKSINILRNKDISTVIQ
ncbi:MAG: DNA polymerase III subunit alpha [Candidatus Pelagibacter sp.]|nr:DNA polymerase III subunit alpha [Candidatus Pelagibacter sp.]MDB2500720.1 DNA polymerase III subunit alpha [Candidatus Pelagibacter bacterium]MDC0448003.1 DNA polymerase III subunit alpha [Candidatus Pelagibacter sp.]MDC1082730.1 DNA polymerase III subunit alpha [Candidatus Pelagibacter sp.]|tara:strand:- start:93 stop:3509 length:3417 start_codon:yes stop_codon:yes gene_type:complete